MSISFGSIMGKWYSFVNGILGKGILHKFASHKDNTFFQTYKFYNILF